jgi:hypothetical protein
MKADQITTTEVKLEAQDPKTSSRTYPKPKPFSTRLDTKLLKDDNKKASIAASKADFNLAERHQQARVVRDLEILKGEETALERCVCCNLPINAPTFGLCDDTYLLKQLGPGFPLYYRFAVFIWGMLLFTFIIAGMACWAYNLSNDKADDWEAENDSFTVRSSLGNNGDPDKRDDVFPLWQFVLHLVAMAVILACYHLFWNRRQASLQEDIDRDMSTPSDYTIYASNLGKPFTEDEVREFFTKHGRPDGQPAEVVKVNITYDISEFVELSRALQELKNRKNHIERYKEDHDGAALPVQKTCCCCVKSGQSYEEVLKAIESTESRIKEVEGELEPGVGRDLLNGQAFVTFKTQAEARLVRYKWEGEWQDHFWNSIFRCCRKQTDRPHFNSNKIRVKRAPEPNDIFWENLSYRFSRRLGHTFITLTFTLICLVASFALIYGTSYYQQQVNDKYKDKENISGADLVKIRALSILPSFGIVFINMVLGQLIRRVSSFEKHHTLTSYHASVAVKLTVAQCINTALIAIIVNFDPERSWFTPGGLATDMTYILLSNAFLQPISYIFSPMYLLRLCKRRSARKNPYCTQAEANMVYEGPPVDMAQRYANIMKTFIVTLAFAALIPLGILFSLFGVLFSYWVDKYLLLRRHARPSRLSGNLSEVMSLFVPWGVLIYAILSYIWMNALNPDDSAIAFVWMLMVIGYIFLPINTLQKCRKIDIEKFSDATYEKDYYEAAVAFVDDYDRENPITSEKGWAWYFDQLEKSKNIEEEDLIRLKQEMMNKMSDVRSVVSAYATSNPSLNNYNMYPTGPTQVPYVHPSTHQKIKSAIMMSSGQQNYVNSYQAPASFVPFSGILRSHYGPLLGLQAANSEPHIELPAYVPPKPAKPQADKDSDRSDEERDKSEEERDRSELSSEQAEQASLESAESLESGAKGKYPDLGVLPGKSKDSIAEPPAHYSLPEQHSPRYPAYPQAPQYVPQYQYPVQQPAYPQAPQYPAAYQDPAGYPQDPQYPAAYQDPAGYPQAPQYPAAYQDPAGYPQAPQYPAAYQDPAGYPQDPQYPAAYQDPAGYPQHPVQYPAAYQDPARYSQYPVQYPTAYQDPAGYPQGP